MIIKFSAFADNIGSAGKAETRKTFSSRSGYRSYFGHNPPPGVNFAIEWVVFYSAGVRNTGGYRASIDNISTSTSGLTLRVTTVLRSPGPGSRVTMALTKPYVLVKFRRPTPTPYYVHYYRDDVVQIRAGLTSLGARRLPKRVSGEFGGPSTVTRAEATFTGTVAKSEWQHHGPFAVAAGGTFEVAMTGDHDADLYVRWGSRPTTRSYDCRPYKNGSTESCTGNTFSGQQLYVSVRGYAALSGYSLTTTYDT